MLALFPQEEEVIACLETDPLRRLFHAMQLLISILICSNRQTYLQEEMERYNLLQADCFADGDYLELLDLLDPQSSSSNSESSSCVSCPSDLYFDSAALLQELEHEDEVCQTKPIEMTVSPTPEGSPISGNNKPIEPVKVEGSPLVLTLKRDKDHPPQNTRKRPPPVSDDADASSSSQKPGTDKGKKVARGKTLKKFFCFVAF